MMRVKKNDTVVIRTGKDKGKTGAVIDILPDKDKVKVRGIAVITKHVKARRQGQASGIVKEESYIHLSNVMPLCSSCSKPCRVHIKISDDGKKARVCSQCQEIL
jgi:large subunit ribosomal protein L24